MPTIPLLTGGGGGGVGGGHINFLGASQSLPPPPWGGGLIFIFPYIFFIKSKTFFLSPPAPVTFPRGVADHKERGEGPKPVNHSKKTQSVPPPPLRGGGCPPLSDCPMPTLLVQEKFTNKRTVQIKQASGKERPTYQRGSIPPNTQIIIYMCPVSGVMW